MTLDDLVGQIPDAILANPGRCRAVLLGMAMQGLALPAGLAPYMTLPPPEPRNVTRARMAEFIARRVAADGLVTREDLEGAGFTGAEISQLFGEAKRIARVERMAA